MELQEREREQLRGMKVGSHIDIKIPTGGMTQFLDEMYFGYKLKMRYQYPLAQRIGIFQKTENIYGDYIGPDAIGTETNEKYLPH